MATPTLEETLREVAINPYLTAILQLAQAHACTSRLLGAHIEIACAHIESLSHAEKLAVVPHLRRLGYSVVVFRDSGDDLTSFPFRIHCPGKAHTPKMRQGYSLNRVYYSATSPGMLRLRGFLWCTPRLMAWKWRAVVKANAPDAPGGQRWMAEYGSMMAL